MKSNARLKAAKKACAIRELVSGKKAVLKIKPRQPMKAKAQQAELYEVLGLNEVLGDRAVRLKGLKGVYMTDVTETKRRNGYYQWREWQLPAVSTPLKSAGNNEGLMTWAAQSGGLGVIWGLSGIKSVGALAEKLKSSACIEWAKEQAVEGLEAERERPANFGTNLHSGIESFLKGFDFDISGWTPEMIIGLETFKAFYKEVGFDPVLVESQIFYTKELEKGFGFSGRLDLVAGLDVAQVEKLKPYLMKSSETPEAGLMISDFKTGKLYIPKQEAQLSAYMMGYEETYDRKVTGGLLINIPRETPDKIKCYYSTRKTLDHAFEAGIRTAYATWLYFDAPKWFKKQFNTEAL